ncbi:uncharacterized protein LOC130300857 [Hyla sarda]|uniref:uncharacterized protein LOC130300857 n=1 Tax=Hyla sarda TaxID=327740 RepID=UPI0024C463AB|nr:uncharacterized protein LOC130300857 [Hyla sarda]
MRRVEVPRHLLHHVQLFTWKQHISVLAKLCLSTRDTTSPLLNPLQVVEDAGNRNSGIRKPKTEHLKGQSLLFCAGHQRQKATRVQKKVLEENSRRLTAQLEAAQEVQRKEQETLTVLQQITSVAGQDPGMADATHSSIRASHLLQKITTADDVEAYLTTFKRSAKREGWPKVQWAGLFAPFLSGEPQKAYFDLENRHATDYDKLKNEILSHLGVTLSVRAQRVRNYSMDKPPRSQMHNLIHLTKKWLQPEILTGPQMVKQVVMDQYFRALPVTLCKWVSHGDPKNDDQMVEME